MTVPIQPDLVVKKLLLEAWTNPARESRENCLPGPKPFWQALGTSPCQRKGPVTYCLPGQVVSNVYSF